MIDDPYGDPDLVTLYDLDNPDGEDHDFYRALATEAGACTIVDLGCGTGLLTRTFAGPGRRVTGVDPSATMLAFARRQPGADAVTWVLGDATALPADGTADLVVCTGNAFMHVGDDELAAALHAVAATLRPGGTFAFETRNPADRAWQRWTREHTDGERETHLGRLREWQEVTEVDGGRVTFDAHDVLPDGEHRVSTSVLWFRTADVLDRALRDAGFTDVRIRGGWHDEPVTDRSRLLVVRAERAERETRVTSPRTATRSKGRGMIGALDTWR